jgi:hypothetical protein
MTDRITDVTPYELAADPSMVPMMISGGNRNGIAGTGDLRPQAMRPGCDDHQALPSRIGNRLHYRDGRVVHMPSDDTEGGEV